jgi:hypothetical protein
LDSNRRNLGSNEVNLGWLDRSCPRKGGRHMMEIDECFHELNAAVKEYYQNKKDIIPVDGDVELYYTYGAREEELLDLLKSTKEFLEWGASI